MNKEISTNEFVALLGFSIENARNRGWLEESDVLFSEHPMKRKSLARIVHEFIKRELSEEDDLDVESALCLSDLYDCRVCVNHIMQVFSKGIMGSLRYEEAEIFGNENTISYEEALLTVQRIYDKDKRIKKEERISKEEYPGRVSFSEALELIKGNEKAVLIDVRPEYIYEKEHPDKAVNIPFTRIVIEGKKALGNHFDSQAQYFLFCENGYLNEISQKALQADGIKEIFRFCNDQST